MNEPRMSAGDDVTLAELEAEHIRLMLGKGMAVEQVAKVLGIDQATLYRRKRRMGLPCAKRGPKVKAKKE